ncbi:MAG TPA: methionyl-tRNA formyltransferase [Candidatus Krumholzibacteria bacterium]|nr:methionyl-tRNA formyltransferase [Candidatus Krumholzibacteria bacterium]
MTSQRIVFMGSPDFAVPSLDALVESGRYRPLLVVSQPDRPRGRGQAVDPTPVRARALNLGIPTLTMTKETYAEGVEAVRAARPDAIIVVAFGLILRRDLLDMPEFGCINVHASLLPRHRGVSPIQAAILAGDEVTGCTTMRIDEGVDTGNILLRAETPIAPDDTAGTLTARLAGLGAGLLLRTLDGVFDGSVHEVVQDNALATVTKKIRKHHGLIDWTRSAVELERRVRAMTPWPSAYSFLNGRRLLIDAVAVAPQATNAAPGTVVSLEPLVVACGEGALDIRMLRPEGRRSMPPRAFRAGNPLEMGEVFSTSID